MKLISFVPLFAAAVLSFPSSIPEEEYTSGIPLSLEGIAPSVESVREVFSFGPSQGLPSNASAPEIVVTLDDEDYDNAGSLDISSHVRSDSGNLLDIVSYSSYSRDFYSGSSFSVPEMPEPWDYTELLFPKLNLYIVNNSSRTVNVSSLEFVVSGSVADKRPYFNIATTSGKYCNEMSIANLGYSSESYLELSYRILKKGESFDGRYTGKRVLPSSGGSIDFFDDLVALGYNYKAMKASNPGGVDEWYSTEGGKRTLHRNVTLWDLSEEQIRRLFSPFSVEKKVEGSGRYAETYFTVYAPIYCELRCPGSGKTFRFHGKLCLGSMSEYGAEMDEDDSFDVQLRDSYQSYTVKYPYNATVVPGGSVKVGLTVKCSRSSTHKFYIRANNESGVTLRSRDISLQILNPRNSSPKKGWFF